MNATRVKGSAVLLMVGGLVYSAAEVLEMFRGVTSGVVQVMLVGFACLGLGVWGAHFGQADKGGRLSLVGTGLLSVAYLIFAGGMLTMVAGGSFALDASGETRVAEQLWVLIGFLFMILGAPLFGFATLRARVYPRWIGVALLVLPVVSGATALMGVLATVVTNLSNILVIGLVNVLMGWYVLSGRTEAGGGEGRA